MEEKKDIDEGKEIGMNEEEKVFYRKLYRGLYGTDRVKAFNKIKELNLKELLPSRVYVFIMDYLDSLEGGEVAEVKKEEKTKEKEEDDSLVSDQIENLAVQLKEAEVRYKSLGNPEDKKLVTNLKRKITNLNKKLESEY